MQPIWALLSPCLTCSTPRLLHVSQCQLPLPTFSGQKPSSHLWLFFTFHSLHRILQLVLLDLVHSIQRPQAFLTAPCISQYLSTCWAHHLLSSGWPQGWSSVSVQPLLPSLINSWSHILPVLKTRRLVPFYPPDEVRVTHEASKALRECPLPSPCPAASTLSHCSSLALLTLRWAVKSGHTPLLPCPVMICAVNPLPPVLQDATAELWAAAASVSGRVLLRQRDVDWGNVLAEAPRGSVKCTVMHTSGHLVCLSPWAQTCQWLLSWTLWSGYLFYRWRNWSTGRLGNSLEITQ